ncbi:hypothetical protein EJD97_019042 [Solanum chilense]|uniref:Uncharacterized protein n=1 Tax=Solanum chilense TaxID=4083 RepID=A0A6N2CBK3_SOLCI|nr:hypothetical protein EJD97_019042 [Solanum chilense]
MNEEPVSHNEEIEEDIEAGDVEEVGQDEEVPAEYTFVPLLDPTSAKMITSFLKGIVCPVLLPSVQATQDPTNPLIASTDPKVSEKRGKDAFFHPLLGFVMTDNEHEMLTKFLKLTPPVFLGSESKNAYKFILDSGKSFHKLGIVHQHGVDFMYFQFKGRPSSGRELT